MCAVTSWGGGYKQAESREDGNRVAQGGHPEAGQLTGGAGISCSPSRSSGGPCHRTPHTGGSRSQCDSSQRQGLDVQGQDASRSRAR